MKSLFTLVAAVAMMGMMGCKSAEQAPVESAPATTEMQQPVDGQAAPAATPAEVAPAETK